MPSDGVVGLCLLAQENLGAWCPQLHHVLLTHPNSNVEDPVSSQSVLFLEEMPWESGNSAWVVIRPLTGGDLGFVFP